MALAHGFPVRSLEAFIGASPWPIAPHLQRHQLLVAQTLDESMLHTFRIANGSSLS
jgi:hypothetical protein